MLVDATREAAADFLGCKPEETIFGPNMTTINFNLVHSFCRTLEPGDEIVVTALDHDANVSPWLLCAEDHDLVVRVADVRDDDLQVEPAALEAVVGPRTKVCAFTLASNAVGTMPDARALADVAHSVGALAWMDCVHYAPHRRIDVEALGADVLLCSPYKFFGPHQGLGFAREELLASWPADRVRPAEPDARRATASRRARRATRRSRACSPRSTSSPRWARAPTAARSSTTPIATSSPTRRSSRRKMLDGLAEVPGMTLYGITRSRARGRAHADVHVHAARHHAAPGLRAARRARHPRLGRQLLRARHHGSPRPRGPRRRDAPRLPPLHDRGRGRSHPRSPDGDRPRLSRRVGRAALCSCGPADVAELVDAHGSGPCGRKVVEVQVLSSACKK